jgi:hypothetical protein
VCPLPPRRRPRSASRRRRSGVGRSSRIPGTRKRTADPAKQHAPAPPRPAAAPWIRMSGEGHGSTEQSRVRGPIKKRMQHSTSRSTKSGRGRPACRTTEVSATAFTPPPLAALQTFRTRVRNQRRVTTAVLGCETVGCQPDVVANDRSACRAACDWRSATSAR